MYEDRSFRNLGGRTILFAEPENFGWGLALSCFLLIVGIYNAVVFVSVLFAPVYALPWSVLIKTAWAGVGAVCAAAGLMLMLRRKVGVVLVIAACALAALANLMDTVHLLLAESYAGSFVGLIFGGFWVGVLALSSSYFAQRRAMFH